MENIEKIFKKTGWASILTSVVFAILGLILAFYPGTTLKVISCILGIIFIVIGIFKLVNYFLAKGKYDFYNYDLIFGLMAVVIGIVTIIFKDTIESIFRIIIGIWIIYSSLIRMSASFKLKTMKIDAWMYSLILALLMLACGIFITFKSGSIVIAIGVVMIVYSIIDIIEDVIFMKNVKDIFFILIYPSYYALVFNI